MPAPSSVVVLGPLFEALYVKALTPDGALLAELLENGFDPRAIQAQYPVAVWLACGEATIRHRFGHLSTNEGWRMLGLIACNGYFETIVGRMVAMLLPFLRLETYVGRVPTFLSTVLRGCEVSIVWSEKTITIVVRGVSSTVGWLSEGVLEAAFRRMKIWPVKTTARALADDAGEVVIHLPTLTPG